MNKYTRWTVVSALALAVAFPGLTWAHEGGLGLKSLLKWENGNEVSLEKRLERAHLLGGTVTAVGDNTLTVKGENNIIYTVDVEDAKLFRISADGNSTVLADIKVGDRVMIKGDLESNNTIEAKSVHAMPANTHPAQARGTVTAVNDDQFTLQLNHHGVISNVTVDTNSNTVVKKANGETGTTADVEVGSKVKVGGLWDELLNVLAAIRIKLF